MKPNKKVNRIRMATARYESTEVDRRTWLHAPSGTYGLPAVAPPIGIYTSAKMNSIARLCHIGHGFLKFSLIILHSERKICGNVM